MGYVFFSEVVSSVEGWKVAFGKPFRTPEQVEAGVEELDKFGTWNAFATLSQGDWTRLEKIFNFSYEEVMIILFREKILQKINRQYQEIMKRKAQREAKSKRR